MKRFFTTSLFMVFVLSASLAADHFVRITVQVPDETQVCYLFSEWNSWEADRPMYKIQDSPKKFATWVQVNNNDFKNKKFKFCAGGGWAYEQQDENGENLGEFSYFGNGDSWDCVVTQFKDYADAMTIRAILPATAYQAAVAGNFKSDSDWKKYRPMEWIGNDGSGNHIFECMLERESGKEFKIAAGYHNSTDDYKWSDYEPISPYNGNQNFDVLDTDNDYAVEVTCIADNYFKSIQASQKKTIQAYKQKTEPHQDLYLVGPWGWELNDEKAPKMYYVGSNETQDLYELAIQYEGTNFDVQCLVGSRQWIDKFPASAPKFEDVDTDNDNIITLFPPTTGDVTLTITAPEGTDKVYLVGEGDAFAHNWYLSEAIECTPAGDNTFTHTFENIGSVTYKCYNRISWNNHDSWHFVEKTAGGESISDRTLSFSNGAQQSITVENWENKGYEQRDVTITITDVPKCTDQVWLRGGWLNDDWTKSYNDAIQAVQQPDGSFVATVHIVDGKEFKCYNRSDNWETVEYNGSGSAIEKRITSGTSMSISVAEWKTRAYTCSGDITVTITTPPGTEEVWLAGNWGEGWKLSQAVQCTKSADRTFTYTFENKSTVLFKCLNKNTAVDNEWVYEERQADGSKLASDRSIDFFEAEAYAFTVEKWRTPYQVGYNDKLINTPVSEWYNDQTVNVILTGRTLTDASYNTLCLPFSLTSLDDTPLEGAALKALDHTVQSGDELQLYFEDATSVEAGKPYLVQPASTLVEPVFENVSISDDVTASYDEATGIRFQGILNPTQLPSSQDILFLGAGNELFWPSDDGATMPGMRAYFQLSNGQNNAPVRRVRIVQAPQTVTELESIPTPIKSQKMIENGVLLIQRDGVKYDVLGQQVR